MLIDIFSILRTYYLHVIGIIYLVFTRTKKWPIYRFLFFIYHDFLAVHKILLQSLRRSHAPFKPFLHEPSARELGEQNHLNERQNRG